MTGYTAGRNTIMNNGGSVPEGANRDTVPGILGESGYFCQAIGKMHFTPDGETYGMDNLILSEEMRSDMVPFRFTLFKELEAILETLFR